MTRLGRGMAGRLSGNDLKAPRVRALPAAPDQAAAEAAVLPSPLMVNFPEPTQSALGAAVAELNRQHPKGNG